MLSISYVEKASYHAKFQPQGEDAQSLSPSLQSLTDFAIRYFKNSLVPIIPVGNFSSLKQIKEVRKRVYSSVSQENKATCFKMFREVIECFHLFENVNQMLSDYLANIEGSVPVKKNYGQAIERFADFFELRQKLTPIRYALWMNFKDKFNFAKLCFFGNLKAAQILLKKDPHLIHQRSSAEALSAFDSAMYTGQVDFIRFIWQQGGRPSNRNPFVTAMLSGNCEILKMLLTEFQELDAKKYLEKEAKLSFATLLGDVEIILIILEKGIDINQVDDGQDTAVHTACRCDLLTILAFLLDQGAAIDLKNSIGETPLSIILKENNCKALKLMVTKRRKELIKDEAYKDWLFKACREGDLELVQLLLDEKIDRNLKNSEGFPLIHVAINSGNLKLIKLLEQAGFDLKQPNEFGWSALHQACWKGYQPVVEYLLANGWDVNLCSKSGSTPLFFALKSNNVSLIRFLYNQQAHLNHQRSDKKTPLMYALTHSRVLETTALELIYLGANISDESNQTKAGSSLLCQAIARKHHQIIRVLYHLEGEALTQQELDQLLLYYSSSENFEKVKELIRKGANPNATLRLGERSSTLLRQIIISNKMTEQEKIKFIEDLLDNKLDIHRKNDQGFTPLYYACSVNLTQVANFLLKKGVWVKEDRQVRCLWWACHHGNLELVQLLMKHGSRLDPADPTENTSPLHKAIFYNKIFYILIEAGANIYLKNKDQRTLLHEACFYGLDDIAKLLIQKQTEAPGADLDDTFLYEALSNPDPVELNFLNLDLSYKEGIWGTTNPIGYWLKKESILQMLLDQKIAIDPVNFKGETPLVTAFSQNIPLRMIDRLLKEGADVTFLEKSKHSLFSEICRQGRVDLYKRLHELGIKPDSAKKSSYLSRAHAGRSKEMVAYLLKEEVDLHSLQSKKLERLIPHDQAFDELYQAYDRGLMSILKISKKLAHSFALEYKITLAKKEFKLIGVCSTAVTNTVGISWIYHGMAQSFKRYLNSSYSELRNVFSENRIEAIKEAVQPLEKPIHGIELEQRLNQGKAVVLISGISGHVISLVIYKDPRSELLHLLIENRGFGSDYEGLSEITFHPLGSIATVFNRLNKLYYQFPGRVRKFKEFWNALSSIGADRRKAQPLIEQYLQQVGGCAHDNPKGALGGLFYAEAILEGYDRDKALKIAHHFYKPFTAFERNETLQEAIKVFDPKTYPEEFEFNYEFFEALCQKIREDSRIEPSLVEELNTILKAFDFKASRKSFSEIVVSNGER